MGRAKDQMMQEDEQGWTFSDSQICARCISEPFLKSVITQSTDLSECTFCSRSGAPSVPLDSLMEIIGNTVADYYNRAVNEAPYETAEGGYQGITYDTYEVIDNIVGDISRRAAVIEAISESFDDDIWVERNMFSLNGADRYLASWDEFCRTVKHRTRYFFDTAPDDEFSETVPVPRMLDAVGEMVLEFGLVTSVPTNTVIYRVRSHHKTETCRTREALGSPPDTKAVSNRMSAAGISVFYGAFDLATAAVEANLSMPQDPQWVLTGAAWNCTRDLQVLDLSHLPPIPSIFEVSREQRGLLLFMKEFVKSITAPVVHDGREHIDYVPTQILTEYFRQRAPSNVSAALDGIIYPSARRRKGRSIVLFASQTDLDPEDHRMEPILTLDQTSVKRLRKPRLTKQ